MDTPPPRMRLWLPVRFALALVSGLMLFACLLSAATEPDGRKVTLEGQVTEVLRDNARLQARVRELEALIQDNKWDDQAKLRERVESHENLLRAVMDENAQLRRQITFMRRQGYIPEEEQLTGKELIKAIALARHEAQINELRASLTRCRELRESVTSFFAESPNPNVRRIGARNWEQFFLRQWQEVEASLSHLPATDPITKAFRDSRPAILHAGRAAFAEQEAEALLAVMKNDRAREDLARAERELLQADEEAFRHLNHLAGLIERRSRTDPSVSAQAMDTARAILDTAFKEGKSPVEHQIDPTRDLTGGQDSR